MPPKKGKAAKSHQLAERFPKGEVLRDLCKQEWVLGDVIGQGGFGMIYLACERDSSKTGPNSEYVVKIEPIGNGPLFCELHFYQRVAKPKLIDDFTKLKKLKYLGVPKYIASGQHSYKGSNYRFMVMQRFSQDLQGLFEGAGKKFSQQTVYAIALRLIDALEYLHENYYVHADVKASNCLLGYHAGKVEVDKVYLVDYGLAVKYAPDGKHKAYKEEPKKAHDGTIEFTSLDAHKGVDPSRRADMEILGYCLLQWLCGRLPWEDKLNDKNYVAESKRKYMNDIPGLMRKCFAHGSVPDEISKYLTLVMKLGYEEKPNYQKMRDIFTKGLGNLGVKDSWKLGLPVAGAGVVKTKASSPVKKPAQKRVKETKAGAEAKPKSPRPGTPKTPKTAATPKTATPKARVRTPAKDSPAVNKMAAKKRVASPAASRKTTPVQKKAKTTVAQKKVKEAKKTVARSPAATKAARVGAAALSPLGDGPIGVNGIAKRAKSPGAAGPEPKRRKVTRRKGVQLSEMAVQTSPGLKKNT